MTPEQAEQLATHAASCWPDILVHVWAARFGSLDFAETRAALGQLRVRDARAVTLRDVINEIEARRAPCAHCAGAGWTTEMQPPPVLFVPDQAPQLVTPIDPPELDPAADAVEVARAWAAAIRNRPSDRPYETVRLVPVTTRCPYCNVKETA